ncbi:terminase family protein [Novosphingobium sp. 1949]|uniref:Terminase family protein n=1 Tax=Novosphingobium organovorum TaxID=2930092 RepID=A0ABT0BGL8_9SPHN|nr:terminase family protein [Novosphingobium organovorum]MCJ2184221.1 terminase family protein [Novosphingobium organovorum]
MHSDLLGILLDLPEAERRCALGALSEAEREELTTHWKLWARPEQLAPAGDWRTWLILAGRGFGKTRAGAEWVRAIADHRPDARIALVGATLPEARAVMVEGESGLLSVCPARHRPLFEPSLRRLTWPNGAQAQLFSAAEPETLRGPQHSHAWCDEIAKWDNASQRATRAWDNLVLGLRLGDAPQITATTTPRAVPLVQRLLAEPEETLAITRGRTEDNAANLPRRFLDAVRSTYGRSLLGRQELDGELIADIEGALWSRALIEGCRESRPPGLCRVVVGIDPPASANGDACGIVVTGLDAHGKAHVLADASVRKPSPERWARAAAQAAQAWNADRVVAEANQGGAMVASVLRAADLSLPLRLVHASRGKTARAEPVAALYEAGRVHHAGTFPELEDELCGLVAGGAYQGPGRSPDRADALVWALTELMLGKTALPRVRLA